MPKCDDLLMLVILEKKSGGSPKNICYLWYVCILEPMLWSLDDMVGCVTWFKVEVPSKDNQVCSRARRAAVGKIHQLLRLFLSFLLVDILAATVEGVPNQMGDDGIDLEAVEVQTNPASSFSGGPLPVRGNQVPVRLEEQRINLAQRHPKRNILILGYELTWTQRRARKIHRVKQNS